jgi:hypothetical protein
VNTRTALRRMAAQDVPTDARARRAAPESVREHSLHRILGARRPHLALDPAPGGRRWRPVLVVGVAVVAVLAAVAVFALPGPVGDRSLDGVALVPVSDSAEVLGQLADRAAAQSLPAEPFDYLHSTRWTRTPGADGYLESGEELLTESEWWVDAEGFGRHRGVSPVGGFDDSGADDPVHHVGYPRVTDLPTDPVELEAALLATREGPHDLSPVYFVMIQTWGVQVLDPPVQAAFLRLLATKDDVRVLGPVTDRIGREGIAVTVSTAVELPADPSVADPGITTTYTLTFDPRTGALLADEVAEVAEEAEVDGRVRVLRHQGSVWIKTGRVGSIDEVP